MTTHRYATREEYLEAYRARRALFAGLAATRTLGWCPKCTPRAYPTRRELDGLALLLRARLRRWYTCACGWRWRCTAEITDAPEARPPREGPAAAGANE